MKSCPTCNRTFEDTFTFCLADGSLLDAPFDPHATLVIPEPRQTEPPPTEILKPEETEQEILPTVASPQPEQKPKESVSTIAAPLPKVELPRHSFSPAQPTGKSHRSSLIIVGFGALLVIGLIYFIVANWTSITSSGKVTDITDSNYDSEVLNSRLPVLLHFGAAWQSGDGKLSSIVEHIAKEYAGRIKVGRVDENYELIRRFNVTALPMFIIIKNGVEQERFVMGDFDEEQLRRRINKYTNNQ